MKNVAKRTRTSENEWSSNKSVENDENITIAKRNVVRKNELKYHITHCIMVAFTLHIKHIFCCCSLHKSKKKSSSIFTITFSGSRLPSNLIFCFFRPQKSQRIMFWLLFFVRMWPKINSRFRNILMRAL